MNYARMRLTAFGLLLCLLSGLRADPLKVCGVHWPPHTIAGEDGRLVAGKSLAIVDAVFSRLGLTFEADRLPWRRCTRSVATGEYDVVIDADAGAFPEIHFGQQPITFNPVAIYVRDDHPARTLVPESIKDSLIGTVAGYEGYVELAERYGWQLYQAKSERTVLLMLVAGRLDYALLDTLSVPRLSGDVEGNVRALYPVVQNQLLYLGFSEEQAGLIEDVDRVLMEMQADGSIDRLYRETINRDYAEMRSLKAAYSEQPGLD